MGMEICIKKEYKWENVSLNKDARQAQVQQIILNVFFAEMLKKRGKGFVVRQSRCNKYSGTMEQVLEACRLDFQRAYERGAWGLMGMPTQEMIGISNLRSDDDQKRIWRAFVEQPRLSFCGDVLHLLMRLRPYPIPATRVGLPPPAFRWETGHEGTIRVASPNVHTGDITNFSVPLDETLRQYELNVDFAEIPEFLGVWPDEVRRVRLNTT